MQRIQPSKLAALLTGACASGLLCLAALGHAGSANAQAPAQPTAQVAAQPAAPSAAAPSAAQAASAAASGRAAARKPTPAKTSVKRSTQPLWSDLTPPQQWALAPLATHWNTLSVAQKRKWLALSQNYPTLNTAERAKLQSRMTEWIALSPQQRTLARLNFGETQQIRPDDKKAKWEAYQALSAEEKRKLAAKANKPPTTAAAVKPVSPDKLATVPPQKQSGGSPRIAVAPDQLDHNTLLPQQSHGPGIGPSN